MSNFHTTLFQNSFVLVSCPHSPYRHGMCFRGIHFILISTAHALFLTCLPVSIYGT